MFDIAHFSFTPLFWIRFLLGKHQYLPHGLHPEIRRGQMMHLVAFRKSDGTWYIRRKYRLIYSPSCLNRIAGGHGA